MTTKISDLLSSIRFWQVTFATVFVLLGNYYPEAAFAWNTLATYLATVAGIGTLDSVATKISSKKKEE